MNNIYNIYNLKNIIVCVCFVTKKNVIKNQFSIFMVSDNILYLNNRKLFLT